MRTDGGSARLSVCSTVLVLEFIFQHDRLVSHPLPSSLPRRHPQACLSIASSDTAPPFEVTTSLGRGMSIFFFAFHTASTVPERPSAPSPMYDQSQLPSPPSLPALALPLSRLTDRSNRRQDMADSFECVSSPVAFCALAAQLSWVISRGGTHPGKRRRNKNEKEANMRWARRP